MMMMMKTLLCFTLFCFFAVLSAQQPPKISEVFHSKVTFHVSSHHGNFSGHGVWAGDQPNGKSVQRFDVTVHHDHISSLILERFDVHRGFEMNHDDCHSWPLTHHMPEIWGWLKNAQNKGKQQHNGKTCDLWELSAHGYARLRLCVDEQHPTTPVWFESDSVHQILSVDFHSFDTHVDSHIFDIPKQCNHTTETVAPSPPSVGCVSRNTMLKRAQKWVDHHVPYNQQGHYNGYREDCSGYVSMAWGLSKPGLVTSTLPHVSHKISKKDLRPGDVLLNVNEHVVLFGGWTDKSKTHYVAYEETRPGEGTVKRVTPYPYWYSTNLFHPYRYNSVC